MYISIIFLAFNNENNIVKFTGLDIISLLIDHSAELRDRITYEVKKNQKISFIRKYFSATKKDYYLITVNVNYY